MESKYISGNGVYMPFVYIIQGETQHEMGIVSSVQIFVNSVMCILISIILHRPTLYDLYYC